MVARVNVPGVGPMYFPESMSNEDITAKVDATLESLKGLHRPELSERPPMEGMSSARREILDTIAGTEAPDYNTLYGGRKIADLSRHPGIDVPIMSGPNVGKTSSAFGRYQFLEPTWNEQAKKLGLKDMSPASQDAAAWNLASETYQNKTGRNLEQDWASGDPAIRQSALRALSGVWTSLPGGIEQNAKYGRGRILDPKDLPTSELIKGGWQRGLTGLEGTVLDLIPAFAGSMFGQDDYAKQQLEEYNQRMAAIQEQYPTAYESFKDIGSIGNAFDYGAETIGEAGPDIVAFLTGSGIGSFAGRKLAKKALADEIKDYAAKQGLESAAAEKAFADRLMDKAIVGSWVGSGGVSAGLNIPETFDQIYRDTGELHPGIAASLGGAKAMLDTIVPQKIWGHLTNAGRTALTAKIGEKVGVVPKSWGQAFALEAGELMAAEGLTEGTQTAIDNLASRIAGSNKDLMENVFDSAIRGAIGGGAFGAPGAAIQASRRPQEPNAQKELTGIEDQRERLMLPSPDQADAQFRSQFNAPGTPQQTDMWGFKDVPLERYHEQMLGVDPRALDYPHITEWQGQEHPYDKFGGVRPTALDTGPVPSAPRVSSVIDEDVLSSMGFSPRAGFYKDLIGKDLSNEQDRTAVEGVLKRVKANSKISSDRKAEIGRIIKGLTPTPQQTELSGYFAPQFESQYGEGSESLYRKREALGKERPPTEYFDSRDTLARARAGASIPSGPGTGVPAGRVGISEAGGMAGDTSPVSGIVGRTPDEQRALEAEQISTKQKIRQLREIAEQAKQEGDTKTHRGATLLANQLEGVEAKKAAEKPAEQRAVVPSEDIQNQDDHSAVSLLKKKATPKGDAKSAQTYFNQMPTLMQSLASIANDLVYPTPRYRAEPEMEGTPVAKRYEGTGGQAARAAANWVQKNLSPEANDALDRLIQENQKQREKTDAMDKTRWDLDDLTERNQYGALEPGAPSVMGGTSGNRDFYDRRELTKSAPAQVFTVVGDEYIPNTNTAEAKIAVKVVDALEKDATDGNYTVLQVIDQTLTPQDKVTITNELGNGDYQQGLTVACETASSIVEEVNNLNPKLSKATRAEQIKNIVAEATKNLSDAIRRIIKKITDGIMAFVVSFNFNYTVPLKEVKLPSTTVERTETIRRPTVSIGEQQIDPTAREVANHALRTGEGKSFMVVDKPNAMMYAFDGKGTLVGKSPVLTGRSRGDARSEESLTQPIEKITEAERVTPAGRFDVKKVPSDEYGEVFSLDKAGTIAVHRTYLGNPSEHRLQRLSTATPEDNRVSYGCINVPAEFYDGVLSPTFNTGSAIYVMPDTLAAKDVFGITDTRDEVTQTRIDSIEGQQPGTARAESRSIVGRKEEITGNLDSYDRQESERARSTPMQVLTRVEGDPTSGPSNEVSKLAKVLSPEVVSALREGNLRQALTMHGAKIGGVAERIARILAKNIGDTKVVVSLGLLDESGKPVNGYYDPKTNTIHLDATTGLNSHVLIHEAVHPVMSHVLDDPNNPLTRNLTQLFEKVKDSLGSAYGAKDVQEFAAEAWGNQEMANTLRSMHPDGYPHTAWDRFVRAISNFFRRLGGLPPKSLASAYDKVDALLSAIASPAPQYRDASILYAPNQGPKYAMNMTDKIIDAAPFFSERQKSALSQAIGSGSDMVSSGIFSLLTLNALTDLAEKYFPNMARKISELVNQRGGYEKTLNKMIDPIVHLAKQAIKIAGQQQSQFDDLVHESTIKMVDPTRPREYYDGDADKQRTWDDLNSRYRGLKSVWQNMYVRMRDAYKGMYEEIRKSIDDRIDGTDVSKETKVKIKADIMKEMSKKGLIDPYFALGRQGDLWLSAPTKDKNGQVDFTVEAFKSTLDRQKRIKQLISEGTDPESINTYANINEVDYRRAPAGSFVNSVFHLMKTNGVSDQAIDEMMRLFISTLPETAFAKSMQARKEGGRSGYDKDSIGVFERKMRGMAHQVSNLQYNPKIRSALDNMREHAVKVGKGLVEAKDKDGRVIKDAKGEPVYLPAEDNNTHVKYLNEFEKHLKYVLNPTKHDLGSILSSTSFHYTLGFNLSSALVNLANVPMIVAPYLMGKYSDASVSRALGDASKLFLGSGRKAEIEMLGANGETVLMDVMPSIANYGPNSAIGKKYATAIRVWSENGQLDRSQFYEMLQGDTRTGRIAKLNALSGWAFHHGERMNREITMIASYDLEMQKLQKDIKAGKISQVEAEERAAEEAVRTVELTNGSIAAASAPRIAHSSLGKLLFMYKRYGVSMYYMLFKTFRQAIDKSLPEAERKAAWKQLGGIYGMSALMAGVQGLPLFGAASMIYALFSDDDDDDLGTVTHKYIGDFAYKGPIEYMTNLAIAGRISLNDLIVRDTKEGSAATTFSQQLAQSVGGPAMGVADRVQRGLSKIREGHIERGLEDILPAYAGNLLKAARYATQGTQTLRGDPITGDVSAWNVGAQAIGFAPADYTRQLEINDRMKGMHDRVVKDASKIKRRYYIASRVGDYEGMQDAKQELLELGAKHPGLGISPATVGAAIEKSMKAQKAATKDMRHGVRYSKKMLKEIKQEEREWDGDDYDE